jgi:hypothetical protein
MPIKVTAETAQLALDTILQRPRREIPSWMAHIMQHSYIERLAGAKPGDYRKDPEGVYLACQRAIGTCMIDQYIPDNPLTLGDAGYEDFEKSATTGAEQILLDGIVIDSPEAVAEHMERFVFPRIQQEIAEFDEDKRFRQIIDGEMAVQEKFGPSILKSGYDFIAFPSLAYFEYGYVPYFSAYALYPDVIEKHFSLQADLALLNNRAAARAYVEGSLPPLYRLDHDMADSRGTLASLASLDKMWFPHFARCLEPVLKTNVRMIWHCDGNLMEMVPRLLKVGIKGFQGFQYEDGMDYERISAMKTQDGESLVIIGGVSVTRTLPLGTPKDVKREITWLVENGPKTGLFLGASSSILPRVPWENIQTMIEGFRYYREHGR